MRRRSAVTGLLVLPLLGLAACGGDSDASGAGEPAASSSVEAAPMPTPPADVPMEVVEFAPAALLLPTDMEQAGMKMDDEGREVFYQSAQQSEGMAAGLVVRVTPDAGTLADEVDDYVASLEEQGDLQGLEREEVDWQGVGDAVQLSYTAEPFAPGSTTLTGADRLAVVDGELVQASLFAPVALWDALALDVSMDSLRAVEG